jgi:hypothetical protein
MCPIFHDPLSSLPFIITFLIILGTATIYQGTLVAGNRKGNKVTKTIFAGKKFIKLAYSEEIISQSP